MSANLPYLFPPYLTDSEGIASDTAYVVTASSGGGTFVSDLGGTDSLTFADASLTLAKPSPGLMGFDRRSTDLSIDLNRDGLLVWTGDLMIRNFFADSSSNLAGVGFIETLGGISGTDILAADFSAWSPPPLLSPPFPMPFSRFQSGDAGDTTFVIDVAGGVTYIEDKGGIDAITFTGGAPTLGLFAPGVMGFARGGIELQVDLNRDGKYNIGGDLSIENFFASTRKIGAGSGFIENVGGIPGTQILKLNLGAGGAPDRDGSSDYVFSPSYAAGYGLMTAAGVNGGIDTFTIAGIKISPAAMDRSTIGFARLGKDLGIDLNQDGKFNTEDDFAIGGYFKDFRTDDAGIGCFEIINGISSEKILGLNLTQGNDDLTGGEKDETLVGGLCVNRIFLNNFFDCLTRCLVKV